MKQLLTAAFATGALALAVPALGQEYSERAEEAFAKLIEGRVAGEPQSCISVFSSTRLRVVEHVGITYERGDTLWIARARDPDDLGVWDVPIIERHGSQLCRHDIIRTVDRGSGIFTGVVFLDDFVPYRKVEEE